ncbi:hypothetical protein SNOG_11175 [Parastagonospora nodorum SN15]|uniref:Uncharacterized protein n=1 Tax=Phaeosphaeria nodorum (strain SN15 / ATCC MYA-4574 / FGSC 10173) TaxID=321614 RepID=Q0UAN9_PHANO|nr:hypothetical protein SNOG_11175 [Parastagonospora nodorum SN15]EAT81674.1 hypothetical protein SNOG_11175 [Parastagonospora nodorum SN15]
MVDPGEATWKDPGFWLEDAEAYSLEPEPSKLAGIEFAKGQPDTALEGFGLQPAGTPTGQEAHEALKQSNEDNRSRDKATSGGSKCVKLSATSAPQCSKCAKRAV